MAHKRKEIRDAIADLLDAGETVAEDRIYRSRVTEIEEKRLPAICVYTGSETVTAPSNGTRPRYYQRNLQLVVQAAVAGTGENPLVDDAADDLANVIERIVLADERVGGFAHDIWLVSTEMDLLDDGKRMVARVSLTFNVRYETLVPDVEPSDLDDFERFNARYNLGNAVPEDDQAEDMQEMETA